MEPEEIITLFDSIWFENQTFQKHPEEGIAETDSYQKTQEIDSETVVSKLPMILVRSTSEQLSSITSFPDSFSPNSVLLSPRLQTIFSGKEAKDETRTERETEQRTRRRRRRKTRVDSSKSLTELEFEELKGFMDLGFVFSEQDVNSNLVEIIPGLQRFGEKERDTERDTERERVSTVQRPYLSEAWKGLRRRREKINPFISCKITDFDSEIDVKHSLKSWAHSVASAVSHST